ncbi:MAG: hypothetical protein HKL88_01570 [Bacteroidia bacterium]|nr:hypothetical protein [Bacteroidia bacterium]
MHAVYLASVYLHIICATLWIGGMLFLVLVLMPAIKNNANRRELLNNVGIRLRTVGWATLLLLLITGLFNAYYRGISLQYCLSSPYGRLFLYKISIFAIIAAISFYHDFFAGPQAIREMAQGTDSRKFVKLARIIGQLNLLLALAAAFIGEIIVRGW